MLRPPIEDSTRTRTLYSRPSTLRPPQPLTRARTVATTTRFSPVKAEWETPRRQLVLEGQRHFTVFRQPQIKSHKPTQTAEHARKKPPPPALRVQSISQAMKQNFYIWKAKTHKFPVRHNVHLKHSADNRIEWRKLKELASRNV